MYAHTCTIKCLAHFQHMLAGRLLRCLSLHATHCGLANALCLLSISLYHPACLLYVFNYSKLKVPVCGQMSGTPNLSLSNNAHLQPEKCVKRYNKLLQVDNRVALLQMLHNLLHLTCTYAALPCCSWLKMVCPFCTQMSQLIFPIPDTTSYLTLLSSMTLKLFADCLV